MRSYEPSAWDVSYKARKQKGGGGFVEGWSILVSQFREEKVRGGEVLADVFDMGDADTRWN